MGAIIQSTIDASSKRGQRVSVSLNPGNLFFLIFIYFWLCGVFVVHALPLVVVFRLLIAVASVVAERGF